MVGSACLIQLNQLLIFMFRVFAFQVSWEALSLLLVLKERHRGGCHRFCESSCSRCQRIASLRLTDLPSTSLDHLWFSVIQYIMSVPGCDYAQRSVDAGAKPKRLPKKKHRRYPRCRRALHMLKSLSVIREYRGEGRNKGLFTPGFKIYFSPHLVVQMAFSDGMALEPRCLRLACD